MNVPRKTAAVSVIGAGIIGSWTALHLAEAGISTTLIEQFPLPHARGRREIRTPIEKSGHP